MADCDETRDALVLAELQALQLQRRVKHLERELGDLAGMMRSTRRQWTAAEFRVIEHWADMAERALRG